jgi:hypothetical protein
MYPKKAKNIINAYFNRYWRHHRLPMPTKDLLCAAECMFLHYLKEERDDDEFHLDYDHFKTMCGDFRSKSDESLALYVEYISDRWRCYHRCYALYEFCRRFYV